MSPIGHISPRDPGESTPTSKLPVPTPDSYHDVVGETPLLAASNLGVHLGIANLSLKIEGHNPTGTHKDRIARAHVEDALLKGAEAICVATCGNYGEAIALAGATKQLKAVIFIPRDYRPQNIDKMERLGAIIVRDGDTYEESVASSRQFCARFNAYDANPGGVNTAVQLAAYATIAHELFDHYRAAPAIVALPVSNGTTLAGIGHGFQLLKDKGIDFDLPKMIGGTVRQNPIAVSFDEGHPECRQLDPKSLIETHYNEQLINWHALDGDHALTAIRSSSGAAVSLSDEELVEGAALLYRFERIQAIPASAAGLMALLRLHRENRLPEGEKVVVLTGEPEDVAPRKRSRSATTT